MSMLAGPARTSDSGYGDTLVRVSYGKGGLKSDESHRALWVLCSAMLETRDCEGVLYLLSVHQC